MFAPDAEARFRKIEDNLTVAAELLTRFEKRSDDRFSTVEAVQAAMAHWLEEISGKVNILTDAQIESRQEMAKLRQAMVVLHERVERTSEVVDRLSQTVDRYLRSRTNGGQPN
jgi:peptidoglycan hydrolase CwlO-like protein